MTTITTAAANSYNDANAKERREYAAIAAAGATTEACKFRSFQKMKLKSVHACSVIAGTATTHGYDVYHGTTSIGTIALSTSAAGVVAHSNLLNEAVASMEQVSVKSLADATGSAHIVYEYQVDHDALQTV